MKFDSDGNGITDDGKYYTGFHDLVYRYEKPRKVSRSDAVKAVREVTMNQPLDEVRHELEMIKDKVIETVSLFYTCFYSPHSPPKAREILGRSYRSKIFEIQKNLSKVIKMIEESDNDNDT